MTNLRFSPCFAFVYRFLAAVTLAASMLFTPTAANAGNLDQNLIARWTFRDGSMASDVGSSITLREDGRTGSVEAGKGKGTVRIRGARYLVTQDISSSAFPGLTKSITIWARVRFEKIPDEHELFLISLRDDPRAADWAPSIFTLQYRAPSKDSDKAGLCFLARTPSDNELGVGPSRWIPIKAGEFHNVALVFDGASHKASMWVDGNLVVSQKGEVDALKDFTCFGIGQLKAPGSDCDVTFDEVRIYSTVLDGQWLEEITPVKD